jgi:hypothetical protein
MLESYLHAQWTAFTNGDRDNSPHNVTNAYNNQTGEATGNLARCLKDDTA